jgi:hypothetical protein
VASCKRSDTVAGDAPTPRHAEDHVVGAAARPSAHRAYPNLSTHHRRQFSRAAQPASNDADVKNLNTSVWMKKKIARKNSTHFITSIAELMMMQFQSKILKFMRNVAQGAEIFAAYLMPPIAS